jgi:hypothetical protein
MQRGRDSGAANPLIIRFSTLRRRFSPLRCGSFRNQIVPTTKKSVVAHLQVMRFPFFILALHVKLTTSQYSRILSTILTPLPLAFIRRAS